MPSHKITILLFFCLLYNPVLLQAQSALSGPDKDLALYYGWLEQESKDSIYYKAYQWFQADNQANTGTEKPHKEMVQELERLSVAFTHAFWAEKDYDRAFYIGFQLEELLPQVNESDYPDKRKDYYRLGEAYYLFLDFHKSIELLEKALSPVPLYFDDTANLDALKIIGICYANIDQMELSDTYFRATLSSGDMVLHRPLYNAYAISHLGCNEMIKGNYDNALKLSAAVWPTLRRTNDYGHLAGMCYCRGRSLLEKGDFKQASVWIDSLVFFAPQDTYNPIKRIKQAYRLQADYYSALGDARQTKVYGDSLMGIYDAEEQEFTSGYIARAAQKYNSGMIEEQMLQLKVIRIRIIVVSVITSLSIIIIFIIWNLYRKKNSAYKALARKAEEWAQKTGAAKTFTTSTTKSKNEREPATQEDLRIMTLVEQEMTERHAYREPGLTLDILADRLNIHRNLLSRANNRVFGKNFTQYVNSYRIKEAVHIISDSDRGNLYIDELYERVGFSNRTSFYRSFKQFTGLSPLEFQKNKNKSPSESPF